MLTTKDNPYSPFDQFDLWRMYDNEMGYQTCERLAKILEPLLEDDMSDVEKENAMDQAIDEIIKYDDLGIYCRAFENSTYPIGN
jgi:hypothetical protein